jgi:hypothetical protein
MLLFFFFSPWPPRCNNSGDAPIDFRLPSSAGLPQFLHYAARARMHILFSSCSSFAASLMGNFNTEHPGPREPIRPLSKHRREIKHTTQPASGRSPRKQKEEGGKKKEVNKKRKQDR